VERHERRLDREREREAEEGERGRHARAVDRPCRDEARHVEGARRFGRNAGAA
jgi:hypothetical protein